MAEKKSQRLDTVRHMAQEDERKAIEAFGASSQNMQMQQKQLDDLLQYRNEYQNKLMSMGKTGITAERLRQQQRFIAQIDQAIVQQEQAVQNATMQMNSQKQVWLDKRTRTQALDKVVERYTEEEASQDSRRDQKNNDEMASRRRIN